MIARQILIMFSMVALAAVMFGLWVLFLSFHIPLVSRGEIPEECVLPGSCLGGDR